MIYIDDKKQMPLFDPWDHYGPKRKAGLENGWPGLFQREIRPVLPVDELAKHFCKDDGRSTKELYTALGTLLLQQVKNLTDEETVEALAYHDQWQYALDISEQSDDALYMCPRTLWNYRDIVAKNNIYEAIFNAIANKLAKVFSVNTDKQRLDSVHIKSNMRRLGRVQIFANTIQKFLKNLKRQHKNEFSGLDEKITSKYLSKKDVGVFAMVRPSDAKKVLGEVASDLYYIIGCFKNNEKITRMYTFSLLERVMREQCNIVENNGKTDVEVKPAAEVPGDSLQNPSDEDAGYSGHKGQGFQAQIQEAFTDTDDEKEKQKSLNLITQVDIQKASDHDTDALLPAVDSTVEQGLKPKELLADSLYGSDENVQKAAEKGVEVVAPVMSEEKKLIPLSKFTFDEKGYVTACPKGQKVLKKSLKKRYSIGFCSKTCKACEFHEDCSVKFGKKFSYLRYTKKEMRLAMRRIHEQTDEFKNRYRWRAGVEATMSEFDRRTGAKHLRYRGRRAVCLAIFLKAAGLNILRATRVQKAKKKLNSGNSPSFFGLFFAFCLSKSFFWGSRPGPKFFYTQNPLGPIFLPK